MQPELTSEQFSLDRLEHLVHALQREEAALELVKLLGHLSLNHGQLGAIGQMPSGNPVAEQRDAHFASRIAAAAGALVADPDFRLSQSGFIRLISLQHWLAVIFGASAFGTADHVIQLLGEHGRDGRTTRTLDEGNLLKFCLLYSPDSDIALQPESLWRKDKRAAAALFLALLSSRQILTAEAHSKREQLLGWLPAKLEELSLDDLPLDIVHTVWMHCSYGERADKHSIKTAINRLVRSKLESIGLGDVFGEAPPREKPVVLCILEWFKSDHSIYRTHSASLEALKARYRVIGISLREQSDEMSRQVFDEASVLEVGQTPYDTVREVCRLAGSLHPDIVYYPSVGMFPETVLLANLRLAPMQMAALGHPATTRSPAIDYVLVEHDYVGDPACFSERIVALPREAMPYRSPANCPVIPPVIRNAPVPVRVAVAASLMKLNPVFLAALGRIARDSKTPVEFRFFSLGAQGLAKVYLQNVVQRVLPGCAVVYPSLQYDGYLREVNDCDMFLNPFPFGNTNGIVDTVRQGLPGVCLTGPEVHSHIDEALFRRLGLPEWLIARTVDEYVSAAVRLAGTSAEREKLSRHLRKANPDAVLFKGNGALFADVVTWLHRAHPRPREPGAREVLVPYSTSVGHIIDPP